MGGGRLGCIFDAMDEVSHKPMCGYKKETVRHWRGMLKRNVHTKFCEKPATADTSKQYHIIIVV